MRSLDSEHYLLEVKLKRNKVPSFDQYPFSLPVVRQFHSMELHPNVTFLIGENGSGKSTLLEAIAIAWGFNPEGGTKNFSFHTRTSHSNLGKHLTLVKGAKRAKDGYFFRAESFYNVATEIERLDEGSGGPPIIDAYGGTSLHHQSHGESFLSLMMNRFGENGFYILDEPESALSPQRQLSLLSRLHHLVQSRAQFVIATHSPILMTYPNAWIYQIDDNGLQRIKYQQSEHYLVTRAFLGDPQKHLRVLLNPATAWEHACPEGPTPDAPQGSG